MSPPWKFYASISGLCFIIGGCMELFMIKTGFYEKVTQLEAQRLEETREDRERFLAQFRAELERQAQEKGITLKLPPLPSDRDGSASSDRGAQQPG